MKCISKICLLAFLTVSMGGCIVDGGSSDNADSNSPKAPTGLKLDAAGDSYLTVSWDEQSDAETYSIYYALESLSNLSDDTSNYNLLNGSKLVLDVTSPYTIQSLENSRTYFLTVTASKRGLESTTAPEVLGVPEEERPEKTLALNHSGAVVSGIVDDPYGNNESCVDSNIKQDCHYVPENSSNFGFAFVKLDAAGNELSENATSWDCVKDLNTGLTWEVKTESGLHSKEDSYAWYQQNSLENGGDVGLEDPGDSCVNYDEENASTFCNTQAYSVKVNQDGYCGLSNWRIPVFDELKNIINYGSSSPSIVTDYFPNTQNGLYWTLTPYVSFADNAWAIDFSDGSSRFIKKETKSYIRLVSFGE